MTPPRTKTAFFVRLEIHRPEGGGLSRFVYVGTRRPGWLRLAIPVLVTLRELLEEL